MSDDGVIYPERELTPEEHQRFAEAWAALGNSWQVYEPDPSAPPKRIVYEEPMGYFEVVTFEDGSVRERDWEVPYPGAEPKLAYEQTRTRREYRAALRDGARPTFREWLDDFLWDARLLLWRLFR